MRPAQGWAKKHRPYGTPLPGHVMPKCGSRLIDGLIDVLCCKQTIQASLQDCYSYVLDGKNRNRAGNGQLSGQGIPGQALIEPVTLGPNQGLFKTSS